MQTKQNTIRCDECGLFCRPYDSYTPFGCADAESPEPYEPSHILCKKCFRIVKKKWLDKFKNGQRMCGDWQKSRAELEASEECNLIWVGANSVGILGTQYSIKPFQYVEKGLYNRMNKLPYYGWCMKCGKERKNGYCSDSKCSESFNYQVKDKTV